MDKWCVNAMVQTCHGRKLQTSKQKKDTATWPALQKTTTNNKKNPDTKDSHAKYRSKKLEWNCYISSAFMVTDKMHREPKLYHEIVEENLIMTILNALKQHIYYISTAYYKQVYIFCAFLAWAGIVLIYCMKIISQISGLCVLFKSFICILFIILLFTLFVHLYSFNKKRTFLNFLTEGHIHFKMDDSDIT